MKTKKVTYKVKKDLSGTLSSLTIGLGYEFNVNAFSYKTICTTAKRLREKNGMEFTIIELENHTLVIRTM